MSWSPVPESPPLLWTQSPHFLPLLEQAQPAVLLQRFFFFLPCTASQALFATAHSPARFVPSRTHVELCLQAFLLNAQSMPCATLRHAASTQPAASSRAAAEAAPRRDPRAISSPPPRPPSPPRSSNYHKMFPDEDLSPGAPGGDPRTPPARYVGIGGARAGLWPPWRRPIGHRSTNGATLSLRV